MSSGSDSLRSDLGEVARSRRRELGMTQEDVAYKLQIEQTVLSKIERGVKKPSLELAQRLAIVLKLPDNALS